MRQDNNAVKTVDNNKKQNKRPWWLLALLLLLIVLTLLTSVIVVIRIGNFLPENINVIFIVPKKAEFHFGDGKDVWATKTEMELFRLSYADENGDVTVKSESGVPVFAPGTENQYTFTLSNTGNVAVDFSTDINVNISMGDFESFPVKMKMQRNDGSYVFGSEDEWVNSSDVKEINEPGTLGIGRFTTYTLIWKWDFESGNDEFDTELGSASAKSDISMSLSVGTYAELSKNSASKDGEPIIDKNTGEPYLPYGGQVGGHLRTPYFPILVILLIIVAVTLIVIFVTNRKNAKKKAKTDEKK